MTESFNADTLEKVRKKYHIFWFNQFKELKLTGSYPNLFKSYIEFQSRKYFSDDIKELIEKGKITY